MNLNSPVRNLAGIGPAFQRKLKKIGIETIEDLLFHFPTRYEDFSDIQPISKIKANENFCISGKIISLKTSRTWKKKMFLTTAAVKDSSGAIKIIWFNQPYISNSLKEGDCVMLAGKAIMDKKGTYLSNPIYEKIDFNAPTPQSIDTSNLTHLGRIIPIYPETAGLSSRWLRRIIKPLLLAFNGKITEIIPKEILEENNLMPLNEALWQAHFPSSMEKAMSAKKRFSFQELLLIELFVIKQKLILSREKAPAIPANVDLIKKFVSKLPFNLTDSQRKCSWQILKDMEKPRPMSRLMQGDVGSGKTVVAVIAALNCIKSGWQSAFMAPTEILAKQHFNQIANLLRPFKIKTALLTGKEDKIVSLKLENEFIEISRQKLIEKTKSGEIDFLIGTHALIQDKIKFGKLALCIVDEQHRFGIEQRAKLIRSSASNTQCLTLLPHLLSMTATPIPRSLALTIYGNLDFSILDELPSGRKKIITEIVVPEKRKKTYDFIRERIKNGEQAFVVCPRIESQKSKTASRFAPYNYESTKKNNKAKFKNNSWIDVKAVEEEYKKLSKEVFPDLKISMLHGKMKTKEKEKIMKSFRAKKINVLVSTSVVEVGVDIPGATIILIEGAERFGLSQLHQFRGRVGRSNLQSWCFLFSDSSAKKTIQRLKAIIKAKDGFELSQKDLAIRGPGKLAGAKQWGLPDLAMENLTNLVLVEKTRELAKKILTESPNLKKYPFLKEKIESFEKKLHLE